MYFCATIGQLTSSFFRSLFVSICAFLNDLIIFFFDVFQRIGTARLVSNYDTQALFTRISLFLGIFMVFRLSFAFVQYIVNPDIMADKTKGAGNVIKRVVISVILLVTTPMIFNMAYKVQNIVIEKHLISSIILGTNGESHDSTSDGVRIAGNLFFAFFRTNDNSADEDVDRLEIIKHCYFEGCTESEVRDSGIPDENYKQGNKWVWNTLEVGKFGNIAAYVNEPNQKQKIWQNYEPFEYDFDALGLAAVVIDALALYIIITYTIQVGIRAIQLAYLQIIAPIPIMMYMTPKGDETLKKWVKQCSTTFFDFFIRIAILCFCTNVIAIVAESFNNQNGNSTLWISGEPLTNAYILVVLIIAVLLFAKKLPKLIQEIFPIAGGAAGFDYGLNLKKTVADSGVGKLGHVVGGAAIGTASNLVHFFRNKKDYKANAKKSADEFYDSKLGKKLGVDSWDADKKEKWAQRYAKFRTITRGINSPIGGFFGGGRAGYSAKTTGEAVRISNENRKKRELRQKSGYSPIIEGIPDKLYWGPAGEKTNAAIMLKEAQWRQEGLQSSKAALWEQTADYIEAGRDHLSGNTYSFLRSFKQDKDRKGKTIWIYTDTDGNRQVLTDKDGKSATSQMEEVIRGSNLGFTGDDATRFIDDVKRSAAADKAIKDQGDIIEGLTAAKQKAEKK